MPISPDAPNYLTVDEAAALLRANPATIRNRIRRGELPAKRLKGGKTILLDQRDVLALLEDAREGLDTPPPEGD